MSYYLSRTLSLDFDTTVKRTTDALAHEGFGVLTDIDVQATLKTKIGADMSRYRILGACNPKLAHQALQLENKLGVLLPCNVIVREVDAAHTEVAAIDPVSSMQRTGNEQLGSVATSVRERLQQALNSIPS
jgi:uncharacterized protein (DUF302 family)